MISPRLDFTINHPVWCRVVGVVWELAIVVLSMLVIPGACFSLVWYLMGLTPPAVLLSLPFAALGLLSMTFGILWSFRRHLPEQA